MKVVHTADTDDGWLVTLIDTGSSWVVRVREKFGGYQITRSFPTYYGAEDYFSEWAPNELS